MRNTMTHVTRHLLVGVTLLATTACQDDLVGTNPGTPSSITRRVDVGGYRLEVQRWSGSGPTVVFLAGLAEPRATWRNLPASLHGTAATLTYDRAGVGESDAAIDLRTSRHVAQELDRLLTAAKITPPYVLVGHSLGALHMQHFAQLHPTKVAGLVFVDGTPAASILPLRDLVPPGMNVEQLLASVADEMQLTGGARAEFLAQVTSAEQVAASGPLPDVPVHVLTSMQVGEDGSAEERQQWFAMHREWVMQVRRGTHIGTVRSGHHIHWDEPSLVLDAIRAVVGMAR